MAAKAVSTFVESTVSRALARAADVAPKKEANLGPGELSIGIVLDVEEKRDVDYEELMMLVCGDNRKRDIVDMLAQKDSAKDMKALKTTSNTMLKTMHTRVREGDRQAQQ